RRTHPAGAELAELAAILAPLPDARGAVAAVVVRVDGVAGRGERPAEALVARRVLPDTVQQLHGRPRGGPPPHVVVGRHAVRVDEGVMGSGHVAHRASSPL